MEGIRIILHQYPELAIFITLALGFALGKIKIGNFCLGPVTGILLMCVLIGQWDIHISPAVKSAFFLIFLFAVGYGVGPQFIHGFKKEGLPQIAFTFIVYIICLLVSWTGKSISGFDVGTVAALLAGANAISAVIVVSSYITGQLSAYREKKRLGACAGSDITATSLGAIQDVTQSRIPALSYTVTYAVGNTLLIIWGVVIVLLMSG